MASTRDWQRVLWKKQHHADNHIPPSLFLSSLKTNRLPHIIKTAYLQKANFTPYAYWSLVLASCAITQHLAAIAIFLAVYIRVKEGLLDPRALVWVSVGCFILGYITWELLYCIKTNVKTNIPNRVKTLKSSILIFLALMSLSSVLKNLSAATSSDSIWALSAFLFGLNALLADYSSSNPASHARERLTSVLSMNAAISSSVVLASRLPSDLCVFALMLFSIQVFALFPMLRRRLQATPPTVLAVFTTLICGISVDITASVSLTATHVYSAVLAFVTFVAPAVLVWAQKYKNEIRGPWDVAVPRIN